MLALMMAMRAMMAISIYFATHHRHHATTNIRYNKTVSKTDPGAYRTVGEALAVVPINQAQMFYVHISAGVYVERVLILENLTNMVLIVDGADVTKVTMNRHAPEFPTFQSGTLSDLPVLVSLQNLSLFEILSGQDLRPLLLSFRPKYVHLQMHYKCTFLGFQDTLYAKAGKHLFRKCDIYGTIAVIFGEAIAVFQTCNIFARASNVIYFIVQGRRNLSPSAFVFQNSSFTVAPGIEPHISEYVAYLGRPWFAYSTVVVMERFLDSFISPPGWEIWPGKPTDKLTYVEYKNRGPRADTSHRLNWTGYRALEDATAMKQFTVQEILHRESWIRRTGIPYTVGLIYV
ncbi:putative pectinesterase/pectinesterase inhibitor 39 [Dorcoceras hygrometricum]|uniref:Putative pectinesterase/pectinesterase inhibitor 39 n=1 Tax=Dorcoceras hygrometricum TaxID=472368 RepID=A0A2Z7B7C2_9LAMI|nr:putative pectinesterase/pectinesterase inhibitor 39 [Dorcoceras hygrometricum]